MNTTKRNSLVRATDKAIAEENARFLADPKAVAEARANGRRWRKQLVMPKVNGCICQTCSDRGEECLRLTEPGEDECGPCQLGRHSLSSAAR